MYLFDLHIHTNYSDGDWPPEKVVEIAKEKGIKSIIVTDHDTISSLPLVAMSAKRYGFEFFEGIEISTKTKNLTPHVLGYSKHFNKDILTEGLKQNVEGFNQRFRTLIERIKEKGFLKKINFETILKRKKSGCILEYDIIKVLIEEDGLSIKDARKLIGRGSPLYIPYGDWTILPEETLDLIHRASGIAVLAHPGEIVKRYLKTYQDKSLDEIQRDVFKLIDDLANKGLDGLEVFYSKHSEREIEMYKKKAIEKNLLKTGGSDWHGEYHHPEIEMGSGGLDEEGFEKFKEALSLYD